MCVDKATSEFNGLIVFLDFVFVVFVEFAKKFHFRTSREQFAVSTKDEKISLCFPSAYNDPISIFLIQAVAVNVNR